MAYKTIIGTMKTAGTLDISSGDIDLAAGSVDNADLAGSIANSKLANSSITVTAGNGLKTGGSVSLGGSVTVDIDLNELTAAAVDVANDSIAIVDANDSNASKKESIADLVTAMAGDGLAASSGVLAMDLNELTAAAVDVANDSIAIIDANDSNGSRKESVADLVTAMAGDGLGASSGVLAVRLESNAGLALASDKLNITGSAIAAAAPTLNKDGMVFLTEAGVVKQESFADYATAIAGDGLAASAGVLAVGVDDSTVELNSDALRVKAAGIGVSHLATAVAGAGLSGGGGSALAVDLAEFSRVDIASGDKFLVLDSDGSTEQLESVDKLADFFAGDGLQASSGVLALKLESNAGLAIDGDKLQITGSAVSAEAVAVGADSFMFFDADGSVKEESFADYATAIAGDGLAAASGVLKFDLNELTAAAVDVANDSIAIVDANDSNASKKESIADLVTAMAGNGLQASSGVLALDANELSAAAVDRANDSFVLIDATDNSTKKESIADLAAAFADGDGIEASSGKLSVKVDDSSVEIDSDALRVKASGITNAMLAGSIANAKLANSTITVGSTSTALGGTTTAFSGLTGLDFTAANASIAASLGANTLALGGATSTVKIQGDLEVVGTLNAVSSTELLVEDKTIMVASGSANSSASDGAGLKIDGADKSMTWSHSDQAFKFDADVYAAAGLTGRLHAISSDATLTQGHFLVKVTTSGGAVTVTLPSSMPTGKVFVIKDDGSAGSNAITIDTAGSETIDGAASIQIISAYGAANLMFDGSNYLVW